MLLNFIKNYIFFLVDPEKKRLVRKKVMDSDRGGFEIALILIFAFQALMLLVNVCRYGFPWEGRSLPYRIMYIALMLTCVFSYVSLKIIKKREKQPMVFFTVVVITFYAILAWGIGISACDSYSKSNLTVYAYSAITVVAFLILEPWAIIGGLMLGTIALDLTIFFVQPDAFSVSTIINSVSICVLGSMVSVFTFYRRINAIFLELEVNDLNEELSCKALIDDLTGLNNRRFLSENMDKKLHYDEKGSGILLFDIDDFKKINDTFGHLSGDLVLRFLGHYILTKDDYNYAVRYGGEEFLIYYNDATENELYTKAEEIRKAIETEVQTMVDGTQLNVTISIGVAKAKDQITYNHMIDLADAALYHAKQNGKNQTVIATPDMKIS